MRSSTSGSDLRRATYALFAGCALVALAAEGAARIALDRVSKIQRRTTTEYRLARTIGVDACGRRHLLMVGKLNATETAGLAFAHVSKFWGREPRSGISCWVA